MSNESKTNPALIALAWLLVGIPLGWGVYRSGLNAVKLFQAPSPAPAAASPPPAVAAPATK